MIKIITKNLKLTWYSKAVFYLPFFIIWLAVFKSNSNPWLPVADFFMAFLVIGSMSSTWDNMDRESGGERLYASFPLKREEIETGNFVTGILFVLFGIIFVLISDILINLVTSKPPFFDLIRIPEIIYLFLIIGIFSIIESLFPILKEIQVNKKVLFLLYITFAMISAFWLIPFLITNIWTPGKIASCCKGNKKIFLHLMQVFDILTHLVPVIIIGCLTVFTHILSLRISIKKFKKKDL